MPLTIAETANLGLAARALPILFAILLVNVTRFDPLPTTSRGAIDSIFSSVFLIFPIPIPLEIHIE